MSNFIIYGLADPDTHEIRYVGQSSLGIKRPKKHFKPCNLKKPSHKTNWINSLIEQGKIPDIVILQYAKDREELNKLEIEYIELFDKDCRLTNQATGGYGGDVGGSKIVSRPVLCYNIDTKEITEFESQSEAARQIKGDPSIIAKVCKEIYQSTKGFIFAYKEDGIEERINNYYYKKTSSKPVIVTFLKTGDEQFYYCLEEAAFMLGISVGTINDHFLKKINKIKTKNILWEIDVRYADEIREKSSSDSDKYGDGQRD